MTELFFTVLVAHTHGHVSCFHEVLQIKMVAGETKRVEQQMMRKFLVDETLRPV